MTSPPYWGHREYDVHGIGQEPTQDKYIRALCAVLQEVKRVLRAKGSLWLNIGDTYDAKSLVGIPWRVALCLIDRDGWILRNDVIWNKIKGGPDNSRDKLRNIHEHVFHFVKQKTISMTRTRFGPNHKKQGLLMVQLFQLLVYRAFVTSAKLSFQRHLLRRRKLKRCGP